MKTIIFTHGGGRFANQMFSYAHLLAFALEYENFDFVNMAFWEYAHLLENGRENFLCTKFIDSNQSKALQIIYFLCKNFRLKNDDILKKIIIYFLYIYCGNPISKYYHSQSITGFSKGFLVAQERIDIDLASPEGLAIMDNANITVLSGWDICDWKLVEKHQNPEVLNIKAHTS